MAASRKRVGVTPGSGYSSRNESRATFSDAGSESKSAQNAGLSEIFWLGLISVNILLFVAVDLNYHSFPKPVNSSQPSASQNPSNFYESNARNFMEDLCKHGTRHMGSHANEFLAVEAIKKEVEIIQRGANKVHSIELDIQQPKGCFNLDFIGHFTTCYENIKNMLVRIKPSSGTFNSALLVNCHYDTAISSPGASDDLVSCAIMLESLRAMSQSKVPLKHAIIMNFNGAEEAILQAAHGFITQHPWAKEIKAFVNLEAAGAGGKEMVFQTGPHHPWLIATYAKAAKFPFASVIGQEIFQSGVIPSDTDFRIYRDFGHIPGIDIAYTYNGYLYHTIYDTPEYIPPGCIQRGGDNLLGILTALANSDQLEDPGSAKLGKMVFFDLLGHFMVYYPLRLGEVINICVIVAVLLHLYRKLRKFKQGGRSPQLYMKLIGASYTMHAVGFVSMLLVNVFLAFNISLIRPMTWYTTNWLTVPMFILPGIATWIFVHQHGKVWFSNLFQLVSIWDLENIFFEAAMLFWTILLAVLTLCGVASAYVCMLLVAFPLVIRQAVLDFFDIKLHSSPRLYLALTGVSLIAPFLHLMQFVHMCNIFFMPMMGRVGSEVNSDVVIAVLSLLPVFIISTYMAGLLHVSKNMTMLAVKFLMISLIFSAAACFTSLGFPYSGNPQSPSAQRHVFNHISREFYAYNGSLESSDHGLLYLPFDSNGAKHVQYLPEMRALKQKKLDPDHAYGGYPYYFPIINLLKKMYVADMAKPQTRNRIDFQHAKKITGETIRYSFRAGGQQVHTNIYMSARDGAELTAWSFTDGTPIPSSMPSEIKRKHYFVYTTSALQPHPDREFWVDVRVPANTDNLDKAWLDIAFGAHYLDGPDSVMPELKDLMDRFPDWSVPIGWTATLQHYRV